MALRKTIPMSELRDRLTSEKREQHGTDYRGSRGGWVRPTPKPTASEPKRK